MAARRVKKSSTQFSSQASSSDVFEENSSGKQGEVTQSSPVKVENMPEKETGKNNVLVKEEKMYRRRNKMVKRDKVPMEETVKTESNENAAEKKEVAEKEEDKTVQIKGENKEGNKNVLKEVKPWTVPKVGNFYLHDNRGSYRGRGRGRGGNVAKRDSRNEIFNSEEVFVVDVNNPVNELPKGTLVFNNPSNDKWEHDKFDSICRGEEAKEKSRRGKSNFRGNRPKDIPVATESTTQNENISNPNTESVVANEKPAIKNISKPIPHPVPLSTKAVPDFSTFKKRSISEPQVNMPDDNSIAKELVQKSQADAPSIDSNSSIVPESSDHAKMDQMTSSMKNMRLPQPSTPPSFNVHAPVWNPSSVFHAGPSQMPNSYPHPPYPNHYAVPPPVMPRHGQFGGMERYPMTHFPVPPPRDGPYYSNPNFYPYPPHPYDQSFQYMPHEQPYFGERKQRKFSDFH